MNISQVITLVNELSDEQESPSVVLGFINDAIAKINIECDMSIPFSSLDQSNTTLALEEKWIRTLLVPFAVGRVKQRDSSEFEFSAAYSEFLANLITFQTKRDPKDSDILEKPPYYFGGW